MAWWGWGVACRGRGLPLGVLLLGLGQLSLELLDLFLEVSVVVLQPIQRAVKVPSLKD